MPYGGRRVFRSSPGFTVLFVGITAMLGAGALMTYRDRGWTWVSVALLAAAVILGLGSIIESLVLRIDLTDDAMVVTRLTGRTSYPITDIEKIQESKGGPPVIRLRSGTWVKLPSVGSELGNSVRAWLKASGRH